jgi:hypothetical protein
MKQFLSGFGWLICAVAASAMLGCPKKTDSERSKAVAATGAPIAASSVCERHILKAKDVAGILRAPITQMKSLPGDAQSCELATDSFPAIVISVRPGVGRTTVDTWRTGKMPLASSPLSGIGDAAVWQETLHELVAQKNAVLCDIQIRGGGADLAVNPTALPAAVGALCNKIFEAY